MTNLFKRLISVINGSYTLREYFAYSIAGVYLSRLLRVVYFRNARAHWIRDCLAGNQNWKFVK